MEIKWMEIFVWKSNQLLFSYIAVYRFFKSTFSPDRFLKQALLLDRFLFGWIALIVNWKNKRAWRRQIRPVHRSTHYIWLKNQYPWSEKKGIHECFRQRLAFTSRFTLWRINDILRASVSLHSTVSPSLIKLTARPQKQAVRHGARKVR